jgi:transcriptional regulator with XRE-family HTH domain
VVPGRSLAVEAVAHGTRKRRVVLPARRALLRGRTLTAVAHGSGLPLSTVSYILNGRVNPSLDSGIAIAKALGMTAEDLHRVLLQIRQERAAALESARAAEWQERRRTFDRYVEKARLAALAASDRQERRAIDRPAVLNLRPGGIR